MRDDLYFSTDKSMTIRQPRYKCPRCGSKAHFTITANGPNGGAYVTPQLCGVCYAKWIEANVPHAEPDEEVKP